MNPASVWCSRAFRSDFRRAVFFVRTSRGTQILPKSWKGPAVASWRISSNPSSRFLARWLDRAKTRRMWWYV
jgi:hypothetical protein